MTETLTAQDIFRAAYENRYTWDDNFPGYTAELELKQEDAVYNGKILVNPDLSVEVTGIEDEQIRENAYNQMRDIITHRKRNSFEQAHGKNVFNLGEADPTGAVAILVKGDAMGSNYKVRGREISQVSRVMGPIAFTINTEETWQTEEGYLPLKYSAIFRNPQTDELKGKRDFNETYEKVGGYYLPTSQAIAEIGAGGEKATVEFKFSNIQLLKPAVEF
jgi:hypothetical protein